MKYKRKYEFFIPGRPEYDKAEISAIHQGMNSVSFCLSCPEQGFQYAGIHLVRPFHTNEYWIINDWEFTGLAVSNIECAEDIAESLCSVSSIRYQDARLIAESIRIMAREYLDDPKPIKRHHQK